MSNWNSTINQTPSLDQIKEGIFRSLPVLDPSKNDKYPERYHHLPQRFEKLIKRAYAAGQYLKGIQPEDLAAKSTSIPTLEDADNGTWAKKAHDRSELVKFHEEYGRAFCALVDFESPKVDNFQTLAQDATNAENATNNKNNKNWGCNPISREIGPLIRKVWDECGVDTQTVLQIEL